MEIAALIAILIVLLGILTALKNGFNEVIKALETVDQRLSETKKAWVAAFNEGTRGSGE